MSAKGHRLFAAVYDRGGSTRSGGGMRFAGHPVET